MVHRTHRELTRDDVACIARAYDAWRARADAYKDLHLPGHVLTPGRYLKMLAFRPREEHR